MRIPEDARINEDLIYKRMTCSSRLGFLKKTPIRKGLGLQGKYLDSKEKRSILDYYKNPNTLTYQGTHNLLLFSTLEL